VTELWGQADGDVLKVVEYRALVTQKQEESQPEQVAGIHTFNESRQA
jgi:hypothetical protein